MRLRAPGECGVQKSHAACTWGNYVSNFGKLGKWRSSAFAGEHLGGQSDPRMPSRTASEHARGAPGSPECPRKASEPENAMAAERERLGGRGTYLFIDIDMTYISMYTKS